MTSGNQGYLDDLFIIIGSGKKERIRKSCPETEERARPVYPSTGQPMDGSSPSKVMTQGETALQLKPSLKGLTAGDTLPTAFQQLGAQSSFLKENLSSTS